MANIALGPRAPQLRTDNPIPTTLSERIQARLQREGITSCQGWQALGCRRHEIFGLTSSKVREIDIAVAEVMR